MPYNNSSMHLRSILFKKEFKFCFTWKKRDTVYITRSPTKPFKGHIYIISGLKLEQQNSYIKMNMRDLFNCRKHDAEQQRVSF